MAFIPIILTVVMSSFDYLADAIRHNQSVSGLLVILLICLLPILVIGSSEKLKRTGDDGYISFKD